MKPLDTQIPQAVAVVRPWTIRAETPDDYDSVEMLVDLAFGPGRFAKTAYRLREGVLPDARLSFVAHEAAGASLWGSVRFWPVVIGAERALLLGPLAVVQKLRGQGIGISLMQHGIDAAAALNEFGAIILVGDEPYYAKAGFSRLARGQIRFPGPVDPNRVLGLALKQGAIDSLAGEIKRARVDFAVCANVSAVGSLT